MVKGFKFQEVQEVQKTCEFKRGELSDFLFEFGGKNTK